MGLRKKLERDPVLHERYTQFMASLLEKGHAELAPEDSAPTKGKVWYIPQHSVQHPEKPEKKTEWSSTVQRSIVVHL